MSSFQPGTIVARVWAWLNTRPHIQHSWIAIADALDIECTSGDLAMYVVAATDTGVIKTSRINGVLHLMLKDPPTNLQPAVEPATSAPQALVHPPVITVSDAVKWPAEGVEPQPARKRPYKRKAEPTVESSTAPAEPRPFSCALFSDGRMLIEKGDTRIEMTLAETKRLVHYMDRMATDEVMG